MNDTPASPGDQSGPSAREAAALRRVRFVARILDSAVRIPGTGFRVGIDPLFDLLPIAGTAVSTLVSLYPLVEAYRLGASRRTLAAMVALVTVDAITGIVPLVGPLIDTVWKANKWNTRLLERHVERA